MQMVEPDDNQYRACCLGGSGVLRLECAATGYSWLRVVYSVAPQYSLHLTKGREGIENHLMYMSP